MSSDPLNAASRPGPRPRFTRHEVLEAALRVIDTVRPEAFTMRRVADELGMGVMTLYGYVRSKEEIVEGVTALAFAEVAAKPAKGASVRSAPRRGRGAPIDASWDEQLRWEIRNLHGLCRRHPNLVTLVLAQSSASPGLFRMRERMLGTLLDAGFPESTALHALGVLCSYALGFGGAQAGAAPIDLPERIRELPPAEFPNLAATADAYTDHLSDEAFEYGLELLIGGLRAAAT